MEDSYLGICIRRRIRHTGVFCATLIVQVSVARRCNGSRSAAFTILIKVSASSTGQIGIGITTKDHWSDLETTLTALSDTGLSALETIVIRMALYALLPDPSGSLPMSEI